MNANISIDDLRRMPVGEIATLDPAALAGLQIQANAALERARTLKETLESVLQRKYADAIVQARIEAGKPFGIVRFQDGGVSISADLPKRAEWDQEKLAAIAEEIRRDGVDPAHYLDTVYKVQERRYTAWPPHIQQAFTAARTVKAGRPVIKLSLAPDQEAA